MARQEIIPTNNGNENKMCQNCGHEDSGNFCSNCGQSFTEINKPFRSVISEVLDVFDLDSRIFNSIFPFLFKPGYLAREYLLGKRKKYISPFRLYLLLSLVFFFLAQTAHKKVMENKDSNWVKITDDAKDVVTSSDSLAIELLKNDSIFASTNDSLINPNSDPWDKLGKRLRGQAINALTNKEIFLQNFYQSISYILFFLMPIFALLLKLLYVRRRVFYIEHLIFSINMHSFALLLFTVMILLNLLVGEKDGFIPSLVLLVPIYFTAGMKRFYQQSYWKIIIKEFILFFLYTIILIISMGIAGFLTLYFL